jgi:putative DNA primase/helicase
MSEPRPKPRAAPTAVPSGFKVTDGGVYHDRDGEWVWVCSPLHVDALTRDEHGDGWGILLRFPDRDGREHKWSMPASMLHSDGAEYRERLLEQGLQIGYGRDARTGLHGYLSSCHPATRATSVARLGWHGARFVLPDRVFGGGDRVVLQMAATLDHALAVEGTLPDWRENVSKLCTGNSRLIFGVSAAFVAPLLQLVSEESGGIHYVGGSSIGKTSIVEAAGSTHGGGGIHGYKRSWRSTNNGLEAIAAAHCDLFLPLDELGQVEAKDAGSAVYLIANGLGKHRSRRDGSGRPAATWRTFLLSTGEITLADKISEDGRRRATAGQQVRILDIPADAGAGKGAFEDLHGSPDGAAFSRRLRDAAKDFYGTPLVVFLERLTENPAEWAVWIEKVRRSFEAELKMSAVDGQVSRALSRFSLIAAAGEMATSLEITGWNKGDAVSAASRCFEAWLARRGSTGPLEIEAGIRQVRKFIEAHGESRFTPWNEDASTRPTINRAGFRKPTEDGDVFFVLPESWREICTGYDAGLIARELARRELLIPGPDGKPQRPEHIPALGDGKKRIYRLSPKILEE